MNRTFPSLSLKPQRTARSGRTSRNILATLTLLTTGLIGASLTPAADAQPAAPAPATPPQFLGGFLPQAPVNNPGCVPAPEHPAPVVLLTGTFNNALKMEPLARHLSSQGYCTWAFNYGKRSHGADPIIPGRYAIGDLRDSNKEIAQAIDYILAVTGKPQVDLVGYSQGGTQTKMYLTSSPEAVKKVRRVVGISPTYHGTTLAGMAETLKPIAASSSQGSSAGLLDQALGLASLQQLVGSPIIAELNTKPDSNPAVTYTNIYTPTDNTATPNSTSQLASINGADVANVDIKQACHLVLPPGHGTMPINPNTWQLVSWGLGRAAGDHTPNPGADCAPALPPLALGSSA